MEAKSNATCQNDTGEQPVATLKKQSEEAGVAVKNLRENPGNDVKPQRSALFEQGAERGFPGKRPGFAAMIGRANYDAWAMVKGSSQTDAIERSIERVKSHAK